MLPIYVFFPSYAAYHIFQELSPTEAQISVTKARGESHYVLQKRRHCLPGMDSGIHTYLPVPCSIKSYFSFVDWAIPGDINVWHYSFHRITLDY